jgi:cytochrome b561
MSQMDINIRTALPEDGIAIRGLAQHLPFAKILHWLIAAIVFLMFASGIIMKELGGGPLADVLSATHKLCGAFVLLLFLLRLGYRAYARIAGRWRREAGTHLIHGVIYVLAIVTPLVGWAAISDFDARETLFGLTLPAILPKGGGYANTLFLAHAVLAFSLIAGVFLHIGVALRDYVSRTARKS